MGLKQKLNTNAFMNLLQGMKSNQQLIVTRATRLLRASGYEIQEVDFVGYRVDDANYIVSFYTQELGLQSVSVGVSTLAMPTHQFQEYCEGLRGLLVTNDVNVEQYKFNQDTVDEVMKVFNEQVTRLMYKNPEQ